ncbi:FKBP-type peptidyl-prolyl cis-trans isomerase [Halochromatium glycolicum]|nr:FKBP-type peptidyl-prolyl cis-trans isomerase [Halochromatium glycolicum]
MTTEPPSIGPGRRVRLHLAIHLEDGTEALSSLDGEPLEFRVGDGTLAPGLESLLDGLCAGADEQFLADGSALFGEHDPSRIQRIARSDLPPDFAPEEGLVIQFETPGGQELPGTILGSDSDGVEVDFNHPLARRGLHIRAQVLDVS